MDSAKGAALFPGAEKLSLLPLCRKKYQLRRYCSYRARKSRIAMHLLPDSTDHISFYKQYNKEHQT